MLLTKQNETRWRLLTSPLRMLPDFIIPGETKCGTTSLFRSMCTHPGIEGSWIKEPNNFIQYGGTSFYCKMNFPFKPYLKLGRRPVVGEASVEYLSKPWVPESIKALVPEVKLIVLLRYPVARALSDFKMMTESGHETEDFDTVINRTLDWLGDSSLARLVSVARQLDRAPLRYVTKGCYVQSVAPWLNCFDRGNVLFIKSEHFFDDPVSVFERIFSFLGVDENFSPTVKQLRKARISVRYKDGTIQRLHDYFATANKDLESLIGYDISWDDKDLDQWLQGNSE